MYNEFLNLKKMERLWSGQASGSLCCSSKRLSLQSRALTLHLGGFLELKMQRGLQINTGVCVNILQWLLENHNTRCLLLHKFTVSNWKCSRALPGFLESFITFLFGFDMPQLELTRWVKRRQRLYLGPQLLHQISLCRGRSLFSSHWLNFEKTSGPKLATSVKEKMVLQMEYRFKERVDLPTSWGLPIALLYPTQTPESSPNVSNSH